MPTDESVPSEQPRCSRCGLPYGHEPNHCGDYTGSGHEGSALEEHLSSRLAERVACRDRQIGSLSALLRGATLRLERCRTMIDDVLEAWS